MSHSRERKENNCLNCNTIVQGKFCHICGQQNIEPKETVWNLITHFFNDITHFDGKFFKSLRLLITKPGFLSAEYVKGRRASYLNPIRMYIFTSALFFLIFFKIYNNKEKEIMKGTVSLNGVKYKDAMKMDSVEFDKYTRGVNLEDNKIDKPMTQLEFKKYYDSTAENFLDSGSGFADVAEIGNLTEHEYDSLIKIGARKDGWVDRMINRKQIHYNTKYKGKGREAFKDIIEKFIHNIPQMMFVSLPLLALILTILYSRQKKWYYVSHAIFSIHLYIFIFIAILFSFLLKSLQNALGWGFITYIKGALYIAIFFYIYKAMHNFYQQSRGKTIFKLIITNVSFFIVMLLLFVIFFLLSIFSL